MIFFSRVTACTIYLFCALFLRRIQGNVNVIRHISRHNHLKDSGAADANKNPGLPEANTTAKDITSVNRAAFGNALPNWILEGDVRKPKGWDEEIARQKSGKKTSRGGICLTCKRWPKVGDYYNIYYTLAPYAFSRSQFERYILWAINNIESNSNIRFKTWNGEAGYVEIGSQTGCWSDIGYLGHKQEVSLDVDRCMDRGLVVHELMHTIGLGHEHQRPDRVRHLSVLLGNIDPSMKGQVEIDSDLDPGDVAPYDFASNMHYSSQAFAKESGLTVLQPNDPSDKELTDIQKITGSVCDWYEIGYMYPGPLKPPTCVPDTLPAICLPTSSCPNSKEFCKGWCNRNCGYGIDKGYCGFRSSVGKYAQLPFAQAQKNYAPGYSAVDAEEELAEVSKNVHKYSDDKEVDNNNSGDGGTDAKKKDDNKRSNAFTAVKNQFIVLLFSLTTGFFV